MNKNELKTRLIIAQGELEAELDNGYGCFDEIAERILLLALTCEDLLDKSSEDTLIQLDKSVEWKERHEYIDGIYLSQTKTYANLIASDMDDSGELYVYSVDEVDREIIIELVKQLKKMCLL